MYRVAFAPEAQAQLLSIYGYIARKADPDTAHRFTSAIVDYCKSFAKFPSRGTRRNDLRPGLRTVGFRKRATIAFHVGDRTVTILGVFYAGQNTDVALRDPDE